jgi:hypothetical protein
MKTNKELIDFLRCLDSDGTSTFQPVDDYLDKKGFKNSQEKYDYVKGIEKSGFIKISNTYLPIYLNGKPIVDTKTDNSLKVQITNEGSKYLSDEERANKDSHSNSSIALSAIIQNNLASISSFLLLISFFYNVKFNNTISDKDKIIKKYEEQVKSYDIKMDSIMQILIHQPKPRKQIRIRHKS